MGFEAPLLSERITFKDGYVCVWEFDGKKCISGGFVYSSSAGYTSDADDLFLVDSWEIDCWNDSNDIFDAAVGIDDHGMVLLYVDESRCTDELHDW